MPCPVCRKLLAVMPVGARRTREEVDAYLQNNLTIFSALDYMREQAELDMPILTVSRYSGNEIFSPGTARVNYENKKIVYFNKN